MELPNLHKELLRERSGISSLEDKDTVCYHHEKKWITGYESQQRHCSDPMEIHHKKITGKFLCTDRFEVNLL